MRDRQNGTPAAHLQLTTLRLEQHGRVLTVGVDAPPFNYMTAQMQQDFIQLVRAVEHDRSVGAVVVTGAVPGRYITHFDIADILAAGENFPTLPRPIAAAALACARAMSGPRGGRILERTRASGLLTVVRFHQMVLALLRSPAVWIAAVNGPCGGGGLEMSVFFDFRIAARETATFSTPELSIGLTTTVGGQRLTHLVGPTSAMELLLEARAFSAEEALRLGLVSRVVPASDLLDEARAMAARYAGRPRDTVAAQKRIINDSYLTPAAKSLNQEGIAQIMGVPSRTTKAALRRWLQMQRVDGESVFLTEPAPWTEGTAIDMNSPSPEAADTTTRADQRV